MKQESSVNLCPKGLFTIAKALASIIFRSSRKGWVEYGGQFYSFPVPHRSTRLAGSEQRATYLTVGNPNLRSLFAAQSGKYNWTYVEQLGAVHILTTDQYRLTVLMQKCTRFLTLMEFYLSEQSPQ